MREEAWMQKATIILFLSFVLFCSCMSNKAQADEYWDFMQVTCDKDLNYFSLRTIKLADVAPKDAEAAERVEKQSGIYKIGKYTCDLPEFTLPPFSGGNLKFPAREITVEIIPDKFEHHGMCSEYSNTQLLISINGTEVDRFWTFPSCPDIGTHFIELDTFNQLTDCTLVSHSYTDNVKSACHEKLLKLDQSK